MHNINTKVKIMIVLIVHYVTQSEPNMHRYEQQIVPEQEFKNMMQNK